MSQRQLPASESGTAGDSRRRTPGASMRLTTCAACQVRGWIGSFFGLRQRSCWALPKDVYLGAKHVAPAGAEHTR